MMKIKNVTIAGADTLGSQIARRTAFSKNSGMGAGGTDKWEFRFNMNFEMSLEL
jgi:hypothetical protein